MKQFQIQFLSISFFLLLVSCGSYPKKMNYVKEGITKEYAFNPYFSNPAIDYVYKANIAFRENNFGGILIIKKIDEDSHRILFTTEMGNKIFDFTISDNTYKTNYLNDQINNQKFIKVLVNDFKVLINEDVKINSSYKLDSTSIFDSQLNGMDYYYCYKSNKLESITNVVGKKEKASYLFFDIDSDVAKNIRILHPNFNLNINLKLIK